MNEQTERMLILNRMKGQVAVITGAGHGIGKGIAERFAREGASVVIAEVDENGGRDTENAIQEAGGDALFVHTDVSSERSVRLMLQRTLDRYGTIHTLVNNAGITVFKPLTETTLEDWEQVMNIDLRGVFLCSKLTAPEMIRRGGGAIINISSNHAFSTLPDTELYAAAKGGVNAMTRSMALSLGRHGIRVNAICPGFTNTPHLRRWLNEKKNAEKIEREIAGLHASGRIGEPGDIAGLAVYLAAEDSGMITGECIVMDGGLSSRLYHSDIY